MTQHIYSILPFSPPTRPPDVISNVKPPGEKTHHFSMKHVVIYHTKTDHSLSQQIFKTHGDPSIPVSCFWTFFSSPDHPLFAHMVCSPQVEYQYHNICQLRSYTVPITIANNLNSVQKLNELYQSPYQSHFFDLPRKIFLTQEKFFSEPLGIFIQIFAFGVSLYKFGSEINMVDAIFREESEYLVYFNIRSKLRPPQRFSF